MEMNEISSKEISPALRAMFDGDMPAGFRCAAVLEGDLPGRVFTDHPDRPTWGVLQETAFGTLYPVGAISAPVLQRLVDDLRREGEVLIGYWPDDRQLADLLPSDPGYQGTVFDFTDRPMHEGLESLLQWMPDGCEIRRVDLDLFRRSEDYRFNVDLFGGETRALAKLIGFYLMRGEEILCEAFAGPPTRGIVEMGVATRAQHRGRGYATITCAHVIRTCEERGYQTYWNCNSANLPSVALARKLGYRRQREYRLAAWFKPE